MGFLNKTPQPVCTLHLDGTGETVSFQGTRGQNLPVFKVNIQKSEPHLTVSRIPPPGPWASMPFIIGTSSLHPSPSSKIDVSLCGHGFLLKRDIIRSDNHHFEYPSLGHFKWKPDPWGGSSLELFNSARQLIAKYKKGSSRSGQIDLYVETDEGLTDLVVVTGLAMRLLLMRENKEIDFVFKTLDKVGGLVGG